MAERNMVRGLMRTMSCTRLRTLRAGQLQPAPTAARGSRRLALARMKSACNFLMTSMLISFGHADVHSPMFVQPPNPSLSI